MLRCVPVLFAVLSLVACTEATQTPTPVADTGPDPVDTPATTDTSAATDTSQTGLDIIGAPDTAKPKDVAHPPDPGADRMEDTAEATEDTSDPEDTENLPDVVDPPDTATPADASPPEDTTAPPDAAIPPDTADTGTPVDPPPDISDPPDTTVDFCSQPVQLDLYEKRIEPLVNGSKPNSCNQCHLSGMDLSMYAKGTPCKTMACLLANELVDFETPTKSVVLTQIKQADPASPLIDEKVITDEYDGFLEWIEYSALCHETVCGVQESPCADPDAPVATPKEVLTPLGACSEEVLLQEFEKYVFEWEARCHGCHSNCKPDYPAPCWLVEDYDKKDPAAVSEASMQTMYNVIGIDAIDTDNPDQSLFLLKPASKSKLGGIEHGGGDKFYDTADDAYQDFKHWLFQYSACFNGVDPWLPVVKIIAPKQKQKFYEGDEVTLIGVANDPQDGELTGTTMQWVSTKSGVLGVGSDPLKLVLDKGKHYLTLEATDSDGNVGTRTIKIWIKTKPTPP